MTPETKALTLVPEANGRITVHTLEDGAIRGPSECAGLHNT